VPAARRRGDRVNCPPAFGRPWRMKTVSPWPISAFWPNRHALVRSFASCFLYKRREFIALLGGAAVTWSLAARAQPATMPVIGYVNTGIADANVKNIAAFRAGLTEAGFVEGQNVAIEFRWAENQFDRLPELVTGLINRRAAVIVGNTLAAL